MQCMKKSTKIVHKNAILRGVSYQKYLIKFLFDKSAALCNLNFSGAKTGENEKNDRWALCSFCRSGCYAFSRNPPFQNIFRKRKIDRQVLLWYDGAN